MAVQTLGFRGFGNRSRMDLGSGGFHEGIGSWQGRIFGWRGLAIR